MSFKRMFLVLTVLVWVIVAPAWGGFSLDRTSTTSGGGTWGSILRMTASLNGTNVTFTISKQSGTFGTSGTMYLKVGTYESYGADRDSGSILAGASSKSFTHDLSDYPGYPKYFYGRYESSQGGYAWVGPIAVSYSDSAPTFSWSGPSSGSTQTGSFTVSGTAYDIDTIEKVTIALVDSTGKSQNISAYTDSTPSSTSASISKTIDPSSYGLAPGLMSIGIWIVDGEGNNGYNNCICAASSRSITWRQSDSAASFSWIVPGAGSSQTGSLTVSGTAYDNDNIQKVTIALFQDGLSHNIVVHEPPAPATPSVAVSEAINPATYGFVAGSLNIGIWVVDSLGNIGPGNCGCAVTDRTIQWSPGDSAPTFTWAGPTTGSNQSGSFTVAGTAADPDQVQKVTVALFQDGLSHNIVVHEPPAPATPSVAVSEAINPATYGFVAGSLNIGIWVVDSLGNTGPGNCGCAVTDRTIQWSPSQGPTYLNVSDWAQDAADYMVRNDIVEDPPDHDLRGTSPANRAEIATLLYRALGDGMSAADAHFANWYGAPLLPVFADVADPDVWYFKPATYLALLAYANDANGVTAFNQEPCILRPANTISRAWVLKALLETWNIAPLTSYSGVQLFDDVPTSHEAAPYVYAARKEGIISGTANEFRPDEPVNREDVFVMLHRIFEPSVNEAGKTVLKPTPSADDFYSFGRCSRIGHRFEQPVLQSVQPPDVDIDATPLALDDLGTLGHAYSSTLQALITHLDPNTYVDASGVSHQASAFCAWEADGGAFVDLDPGSSQPYCRVKWIAPIDASAGTFFTITLYVGDNLGSEVRKTVTLALPGVPTDPTPPTITLDPLPSGLAGGERMEIGGTVTAGNTDDGSADFGVLSVALAYSVDGGANWIDLGHGELLGGGRWRFDWVLPRLSGTVTVRAVATNLQGNSATATRTTTIGTLLTIDGTVVDSYGQPMENAHVVLTGGGLNAETLADNLGSFRFTSTGDGLAPGTAYRLDASLDGRTALAEGLVLTSEQPTLRPVLRFDTAPPLTAASPGGGTYGEPQTVTLACSDDLSGCATTYYTLNGSTPTTSSPVYSGPLTVGDATLQFFSVDPAGNAEVTRVEVYTVEALDFGDALGYPTTLAEDGARHVLGSGLALGMTVDAELDGQPTGDATGDGSDEDGVVFYPLRPNATGTVRIRSTSFGFLDAFFDWNGDGDWSDAGEQVFTSLSLPAGVSDHDLFVPASALLGTSTARFRLSSTGGLLPWGLASDGEVEDHLFTVEPLCGEPTLDRFGALLGRDGGSVTVAITTAAGCPWSAESQTPFVTVAPSSGTGPGSVTLVVAQNVEGLVRKGAATVAGKTVLVHQAGLEIGAGGNHSVFLQEDGTVLAWGRNDQGQLGDGTTVQRSYPIHVLDESGQAVTGIASLSVKTGHTILLTDMGTVLAYGINSYGQAGDGSLGNRLLAGAVLDEQGQPLSGIVQVAAAEGHSLALGADGTVYAWGRNDGRLGDGATAARAYAAPVLYSDGTPVREAVAIVAGYAHSHALLADGTVVGWGINGVGQLGDGTTVNPRQWAVPVGFDVDGPTSGLLPFEDGRGFGLVRDRSHVLLAWGDNAYGQLGDGTATQRPLPVPVQETNGDSILDALAVDGGYDHSVALRQDGTLLAWGRNHQGQLGDGTTTDRHQAIQVVDAAGNAVSGAVRVAAGSHHNLALLEDRTLVAWGYNGKGQLGDGTTVDRHHPVVANGAGAQLALTLTAAPDPVDAAATATLTAGVVNLGRGDATAVQVDIGTDGTVLSAKGTGWTCTTTTVSASCSADPLGLGPASPITVEVRAPDEGGTMQHSASVRASEVDPRTEDDTAIASTAVRALADLRAEVTLPGVATLGLPFDAAVVVQNLGPSTATGVTLSLVGTLDILSATQVDVGTLAPGASVTVGVTLAGTRLGTATLEATVTATEADPVADNTATATVLVNQDGLAGYWPFDEASGDVALDATGRGHDGTLYGAVRTAGILGGALEFNGDSNRVRLPGDMSTYVEKSFTVSLWAKATRVKSYNYLFHDNDDRPGIRLNEENRLFFSFRPNGTVDPQPGALLYDNSIPVPVGEWLHVVAKWDGEVYSGYVNGHLFRAQELPYFQYGSRLLVGSDGGSSRSFDGLIDDVRIYNRALSDLEIQSLATGLVGSWKFDETSGDVVLDSSGNRHDGLLVGYSGDVWERSEGAIGGGVDLKGTNYVAVPDDGSLSIAGAMTVEAWVEVRTSPARFVHKTASTSTNQDNYTLGTDSAGRFLFHVEDRNGGGDWTVTSTRVAQPRTWHHVAGVYDGQDLLIYVDGSLENLKSPGPITPYTGPADLVFGTTEFTTHGDRWWTDGLIDEIRIYRRALSHEEIALHAEATLGWWRFEESEGTRVFDSSGNFHDGELETRGGTPWERVSGVVGQGLDFQNGQNGVRISDDGSFSLVRPFTVESWLLAREPYARAVVKTTEEGANKDNYNLVVGAEGLHRFHMERSSDGEDLSASSMTTACASRFHHVAGTFDGEALHVYVDGVLEGTTTTGPFVPYAGSYDLLLGTNAHPGRNNVHWTDGILDEVAIHARPLSTAQIAERAAAGPSYPPPSGAISSPSGTVEGRVRVEAQASDVDGLAEVHLSFLTGGEPLILCDAGEPCPGTSGSWMVDGVDPRAYGVSAGGPLTLTLTVSDGCGNTVDVATRGIDWMPSNTPATGTLLDPSGPVTGEVAVTASASDADGLRRVAATFVDGGTPLVLCDDVAATACPATDGTWLAMVDPRAYGVTVAGPVTLRLLVTDELGAVVEVAAVTFDWEPEPLCREDFEKGSGMWQTSAGPMDEGTQPWTLTDLDAASPTHSLCVVGATPTQDQLLLSPPLAIPGEATGARLRFQHRMEASGTESGGVLEYSVDGGATWWDVLAGDGTDVPANVGRLVAGGYQVTLGCCGAPLAGRAAWVSTTGWQGVEVDLTDFVGRTLTLRWRFAGRGLPATDGWLVDNVELALVPSCPLLGIFADGFESGDLSSWSSKVP